MNFPQQNDFIDIHTHASVTYPGIFTIVTLMAHEERIPDEIKGITYTAGIHPWYLNDENHDRQLSYVERTCSYKNVIAVGEAGFDKLQGPAMSLQHKTFAEQVQIAEKLKKPVIIHSVRSWEDLLADHKRLKPLMPWLVHGFRSKPELGMQLISKGIYLSFWFGYILRPESAKLIQSLPKERIFLETDGADVDIRDIYNKVSSDLGLTLNELKSQIFRNFNTFFNQNPS